MAKLFIKQAKQYVETRPTYPSELFEFIASKTPCRDLAWDVGTGSGQAIPPLAKLYKNVIGTDTSQKQLEHAPKLPNVTYYVTPPILSTQMQEQRVDSLAESGVDLITVAQALHWFDLPKLYDYVNWVLKKPNGVFAAWCYTVPEVNDEVNAVFRPFYKNDSGPYWDKARNLVNEKYESIYFPFGPVDGLDGTGPFEFKAERVMRLEQYLTYITSWSAYNTAKEKGVELLNDEVVNKFKVAWKKDDAANGTSDEQRSESLMRLSWALVHSRHPEDVHRGIDMVEDTDRNTHHSTSLAGKLSWWHVAKEREDLSTSCGIFQER